MSEADPRVAFGLAATAVALKARARYLRTPDRLDLYAALLAWVPEDPEARAAVQAFMAGCDRDPATAGAGLQDFILEWCPAVDPRAPERVLDQMQAEFDWQQRADLA
jgi:hypothetical protein